MKDGFHSHFVVFDLDVPDFSYHFGHDVFGYENGFVLDFVCDVLVLERDLLSS